MRLSVDGSLVFTFPPLVAPALPFTFFFYDKATSVCLQSCGKSCLNIC